MSNTENNSSFKSASLDFTREVEIRAEEFLKDSRVRLANGETTRKEEEALAMKFFGQKPHK